MTRLPVNPSLEVRQAADKFRSALDERYENRRYRTKNGVVTSVSSDDHGRVMSATVTIDKAGSYAVSAYGLDIATGSHVEIENVGSEAAPDYRVAGYLPGTPTATQRLVGNSFSGWELLDLAAIKVNSDGYILIGNNLDSGARAKVTLKGLQVYTTLGEVLRCGNLTGINDPVFGALSGWGLWATNAPATGGGVFIRGQMAVDGESWITGSLTVGQKVGPGMTTGITEDANGNDVYREELRDSHGAPWMTREYNTSTGHIYWGIFDPNMAVPRNTLASLSWRDPYLALGEAGAARYFLDVGASTLLGEAIAGKFRVNGPLSAVSANFGEATTQVLRVANATYANRALPGTVGWYAWVGQDPGAGVYPSVRGFEWWYGGARQGRYNYGRGALGFGAGADATEDAVWLNASGLGLLAEDFNAEDIRTERTITWHTSQDGDPVAAIVGRSVSGLALLDLTTILASRTDSSTINLGMLFKEQGVSTYSRASALVIAKIPGIDPTGNTNEVFELYGERLANINFPGFRKSSNHYIILPGYEFTVVDTFKPPNSASASDGCMAIGTALIGADRAWLPIMASPHDGSFNYKTCRIGLLPHTGGAPDIVVDFGDGVWYKVATEPV